MKCVTARINGGDMREHMLFKGVSEDQPNLITRLAVEFLETSKELRRDPKRYLKDAFRGDHLGDKRRMMLLRFGLAISGIIYCVIFATVLILGGINRSETETASAPDIFYLLPPFNPQRLPPDLPKAEDKSGGGGGGGNRSLTLASKGEFPLPSTVQIVAPTTRPTLTPPVLAIIPTVNVDPALLKRSEIAPMGLPDGIEGPPSDGPGRDGGFGSGRKGGVGSGNGIGVGPGEEKGIGDGSYSRGGDPDARGRHEPVDSKPAALNRPRPNYTEEARKNKLQGVVRVRVLVGSDGIVKQVRPITYLPDGLTEEAIRAASQMRFRPAMRNGRGVDYWLPVDIEFNLR